MDEVHPLKSFRECQTPPLTQEQLGELLGVSKVSISRWETRERKPEPELLAGISAKTGIAPAALRPDLAELFASQPARGGPRRPARTPLRAKSRAA